MPKRQKPAIEMTTEEAAKRLFRPKLLGKLKEIAQQGEADEKPNEPSHKKSIT